MSVRDPLFFVSAHATEICSRIGSRGVLGSAKGVIVIDGEIYLRTRLARGLSVSAQVCQAGAGGDWWGFRAAITTRLGTRSIIAASAGSMSSLRFCCGLGLPVACCSQK